MESHAVDNLKKVDTQRNGHISHQPANRMVDILKRGLDQRSEHREEGANPKKWTEARWAWTIKWTYGDPSARASGTIKIRNGEDAMREYTAKEMKLLKANPYTFKVTKNKLYFTVEFKEAFWTAYQAGMAPRKH